nr:CDP-glycerol glycerophosphotransferase family protein [uncultured Achromobacter sp.]
MNALQPLRVLRDKLLGLGQTTHRLEKLDLRLNQLTGQLDDMTIQLRAADQRGAQAQDQIAAMQADISRLPQQQNVALDVLANRIAADTRELFGRHANLFHARPPRASTQRRTDANVIERIAFLVHSKELLNHYSCIWDLMPKGSFDVLLHGEGELPQAADLARWDCGVAPTQAVLDEGKAYRYLVSNHPVSDFGEPLIKRLAETNIRFMYAAGKSRWNLSRWNQLYDIILCFGPYHAINFSHACDAAIVQMGYPRFDRYFNDVVDREALARAQGCDPAKPTVVWLPTQGALTSLGHFDAEISALTSRYNVIVKVHPLTPVAEPDRIDKLRQLNFTRIISNSEDNLPLYQLADYMLFDYGGPPMAGIYADKRMVLLNVPGAADDALTGDDSPDVSIRKQLINVTAEEGALASLLSDDAVWSTQQHARRTLRSLYFAPHYGFSAQVAAQALLNLDKLLPDRSTTW